MKGVIVHNFRSRFFIKGENIAEKDMQFALVGLMLNNTIKHNMEREHYLRADFLDSN